MAIKWIGNKGSHLGGIEKNDLLDAYELLEYSLNKLYNDPSKRLDKIAKRIIKRKGKPIKKKPIGKKS
jgi:hypothetical protein